METSGDAGNTVWVLPARRRASEATGLSQSAAIRSALLASAERLRKRSELAVEAAALDADEVDRVEMLSIASIMETMRAAG